ncbi:LysR family transcriptional regulator [Streptomyces sp. NPDC001443]
MLLRQPEYLVALARERHFARAAAACHVSQPSLSAAISRLEHELGVPVVRRGRRYEGLTLEGEVVLARAHRILAERDALHQELSMLRGGLAGTLRLAVVPTALPVASLLTTPFCDRHPRARVALESLSSADITQGLGGFELDAAMTYLEDDALRNVRRIPLHEERYVLLTPVGGALGEARAARWPQAAELPLCLLGPRSGRLAGYAGDVWFPQPAPADHPWRTMPHHGMTPHISGSSLSAQARYAAGSREILECWPAGRPVREEYLIVDGGALAGAGAHACSVHG